MESIMYICISLFFLTLTMTTLASFYVGLKFWGFIDDEKDDEKDVKEMSQSEIELDFEEVLAERDYHLQNTEYEDREMAKEECNPDQFCTNWQVHNCKGKMPF